MSFSFWLLVGLPFYRSPSFLPGRNSQAAIIVLLAYRHLDLIPLGHNVIQLAGMAQVNRVCIRTNSARMRQEDAELTVVAPPLEVAQVAERDPNKLDSQ